MIDLADITENDTVYELGTGKAVLTELLCQKSKYVVSSEIDKNLYELAKNKLSKNQNLDLKHIDGLKYTENFNIFISSLPFSESERFIRWLVERDFRRAVVILQKEFVDKLTSRYNTSYYRAISVISQYCFNIEEIEILSPDCFIPKPKVYSKIVIFTPKSLLRHPLCVSQLDDFLEGTRFREVIDDDFAEAKAVRKVLFCSGKVYYDLLERQQKNTVRDVAIVRLEQLYPFPEKQLLSILKRYQNAKKWCWVQEEPENMGAWGFVLRIFSKTGNGLELVAREADSSPAVGSPKLHAKQQENLVRRAFEV